MTKTQNQDQNNDNQVDIEDNSNIKESDKDKSSFQLHSSQSGQDDEQYQNQQYHNPAFNDQTRNFSQEYEQLINSLSFLINSLSEQSSKLVQSNDLNSNQNQFEQQIQQDQNLLITKQLKKQLEITQQMFGKNSFQYIQLQSRLLGPTKRPMLAGYLSQYTKYVDNYYKIKNNQEKKIFKQQVKKHLPLNRFHTITRKQINKVIWQKFLQLQTFQKNLKQKPHKTPINQFHPEFDDIDYFCQNLTSKARQFLQKIKTFLQKLLITDEKKLLQLAYKEKRFFNIRFQVLEDSKIRLYRLFQSTNICQDQRKIAENLMYTNIWRHISVSQVFNQNDLFKQSLQGHTLFQKIYKGKDYPSQIKARNSSSMAYCLNNLNNKNNQNNQQFYQKAQKKLVESKEILQTLKNTKSSEYITIIFCMGIVNQNRKQFELALQYYMTALQLTKQYQNNQIGNRKQYKRQKSLHSINCSICYTFIANVYFLTKMYDQALHYYFLALQIIQYNGIQKYFVKYAQIAQMIGQVYSTRLQQKKDNKESRQKEKDIKQAIIYYMCALIIYQTKFGVQDISYIQMQTKILELIKKSSKMQIINGKKVPKPRNVSVQQMNPLKPLFQNQNHKKQAITSNILSVKEQNNKQIDPNYFITLIQTNYKEYQKLLIQQKSNLSNQSD